MKNRMINNKYGIVTTRGLLGMLILGKLIEMLAVLTKFYFLSGCWVFKRLSHYVQYLFYK